jgi:hypothetical protein
LPSSETKDAVLYLGLPLRAAIIVYGTGILPTLILPIVYAVTFEKQTLTEADIERVREVARLNKAEKDEL